ncbi:MAG: NAD(P)H-dependent oxidoreductase [Limisphaerales bacterium]
MENEILNGYTAQSLIEQLNWRYATKQFDSTRKIASETWSALEEALVLTPSSYGLQPWKFIVVSDPRVRAELLLVSWDQRQVVDASHLIVFAVKEVTEKEVDAYLARIAEVRGVSLDSLNGFRAMLIDSIIKGMSSEARRAWAERQAYIALGNFLNSAALLGIDAAPMEGFVSERYDEILGLAEKGLRSVVIAAAGYRAEEDRYARLKKVRFAREEVITRI